MYFGAQTEIVRLVQAWIGFFDKKGIPELKEDDLLGLWMKCMRLYWQRGPWHEKAEDLFLDGSERRAWLKRVATNLFLDQCRIATRRRIRERWYAERQG
jgi:hypothetical protein